MTAGGGKRARNLNIGRPHNFVQPLKLSFHPRRVQFPARGGDCGRWGLSTGATGLNIAKRDD